MKKITVAVLLLVLIFIISSCAAEQPESEVFDMDFVGGNSGEIDLEGYVMDYSISPVMNWAVSDTSESYLGFTINSVFADAAMKRVKAIQQNCNCTINVEYDNKIHDRVTSAVISGLHIADLVSGISDLWGDNARIGIMVGLSEVSDIIDIKNAEKWGSKAMLETFFYENDLYGVTPAAWPDLTYTNFGYPIVVNSDLIASLGCEDPREYVENKTWDWDRFFKSMEDYTVTEGSTTKTYGLLCQKRMLEEMFIHSNGSNIVEVDDDGNITYGLYDARAQKGMEAARKIYYGEYKNCIKRDSLGQSYTDLAESFANNEGAMAVIYTGYIYGRDAIVGLKSENFGILPWPHGPDVPDDYTFSIVENIYTGIAIPATVKSLDSTAIILNALYEPLEGFETRKDIRDYMTKYYFFDERDADVFFKMYDNVRYNYFHYFDDDNVDYLARNISAVEFISSVEDTILDLFDTGVAPAVRGVINVMGSYDYDTQNE